MASPPAIGRVTNLVRPRVDEGAPPLRSITLKDDRYRFINTFVYCFTLKIFRIKGNFWNIHDDNEHKNGRLTDEP